MNETPLLPTYIEFSRILQKTLPNSNASQIHGLLCGNICAASGHISDILDILPQVKKSKKVRTIVQEIYETSYHQISEFSFEFSLILPTDEADINARAESLGLWCQGFLSGLNQVITLKEMKFSHDVKEALTDMTEIAKVNFGDIVDDDEDETAYFELVEYVRLSVLMIFHELKTEKLDNDDEANPSLH